MMRTVEIVTLEVAFGRNTSLNPLQWRTFTCRVFFKCYKGSGGKSDKLRFANCKTDRLTAAHSRQLLSVAVSLLILQFTGL